MKAPWVRPTLTLAHRELVRFYRQRSRVVGTLGTPLVLWVFLGSGLGSAFPRPETPAGGGFMEFFFPGILLLSVLFTSIFSNISLIEDRHDGFLQGVLVAPISRWAIAGGKVLGGSAIAVLQGSCFLILAPFSGLALSPLAVGQALLAVTVLSLSLSALGFFFAWKLDSVQGFHGIMNLVLMPMWLLSGAFFPVERAPIWLKPVMLLNPLTYGLTALKRGLYLSPGFGLPFFVSLTIGVAFFMLAVWVTRSNKESFA